MHPPEVAAHRVKPVGVEAVRDDEQPLGVPVHGARFVRDRRCEPRGPGTARPFQSELGAAQRVWVGADMRAQVEQVSTGFREREDGSSLAAAGPSPPGAQSARVGDRRIAWLGWRAARSGRPGHAPVEAIGVAVEPSSGPLSGGAPAASTTGATSTAAATPAACASTSAARRSSLIGATVALARLRRVAGGTSNTAVGTPAAAHTVV